MTNFSPEQYGEVTKQTCIANFIIINNRFLSVKNTPAHYHYENYLSYISKGTYKEINEMDSFECNSGDLVIHPSGMIHSTEFFSNYSDCINISFTDAYLDNFPNLKKIFSNIQKSDNPILNGLMEQIIQELSNPDSFSDLIIEGHILALLGNIARGNEKANLKHPHWINLIIEYLHDNYSNHYSLNDISMMVDHHPSYVVNTFKENTGLSIGEFLRHIRIKKACDKLSSELPLSHLALECGFSDQSHFNRSFKKITGMTPLKYRKRVLEN